MHWTVVIPFEKSPDSFTFSGIFENIGSFRQVIEEEICGDITGDW